MRLLLIDQADFLEDYIFKELCKGPLLYPLSQDKSLMSPECVCEVSAQNTQQIKRSLLQSMRPTALQASDNSPKRPASSTTHTPTQTAHKYKKQKQFYLLKLIRQNVNLIDSGRKRGST